MKFDEQFSREQFIDWINDFLPNFKQNIRNVDIPKGATGIKSIETLGESDIGVRVFVVETNNDPSRRRVGWATDSFNVIKTSGTPNALMAYFRRDSLQWRFSLLTSIPSWNDNRIIIKLSNPKRQSYVVGPKSKTKTPYQYLISKGKIINLDDLKNRFSLEVVNKEFYKEVSKAFTQLVGGTLTSGKSKNIYQALLKLPSVKDHSKTTLEFAVRLIGRIIFCWFLREKRSSAGNSLMPHDLLSLESVNNTQDYYHRILEPIFFEVLNKSTKSRIESFDNKLFLQIPYLNGGLFSPQEEDFYKRSKVESQSQFHNTLIIPDDWFKSFFEVLETYNFTIDENTSFDEELSIDPEMLGRIFENLLAEINPETGETARKSTGSYYTPRVIVDYMVDESLSLYLKDKTDIDEKKIKSLITYDLEDDLSLTEEEKNIIIEYLSKIKILDPACGSGAFPIGALQKIVFILQQIDPHAKKMYEMDIKQISPEYRKLVQREYENGNFDYLRKLRIIRDCIYGVDIQPIATEISRLRCFLTLVVEQKIDDTLENRGIQPLPNLDFKFVTANSLVGLPKIAENQQLLFDEKNNIEELRELMTQFFSADENEKFTLINEFHNIQKKLIKQYFGQKDYSLFEQNKILSDLGDWEPFTHKPTTWFDPEWMFGIKNGFDIIIANPPYVGNKGHKDEFQIVQNGSLGGFYQRRMDLFYFFFHLALNVGNQGSTIAFITTNYYPTATGATKIRKDFKDRGTIISLVNFNELKIFESALGQHNMITILKKGTSDVALAHTSITKKIGLATPDTIQFILGGKDLDTEYYEIIQNNIYDGDEYYIRLTGNVEQGDNPIHAILDKVKEQGENLGRLCNTNQGIVTGADKVSKRHIEKFKIRANKGDGIFVLNPIELRSKKIGLNSSHIRPWYKNSDIKKYWVNRRTKEYVLYFKDKKFNQEIEPEILKHFNNFKDLLTARLSVCKKNKFQWNIVSKWIDRGEFYLLFYPRKQEIFESPKIVVPQRSPSNIFGYTESPWYASADVYFITQNNENYSLKYILALLNSKLYYLWLYHRGKRKGETLELYQKPLSEIPIKKISIKEQKPFNEIVDNILAITKSDDYIENLEKQAKVKDYGKQIDQMVYKLYDLGDDEIKIVEESVK